MRWMRIAAGEGDPDAQGVLAVFLHEGLGTADAKKAEFCRGAARVAERRKNEQQWGRTAQHSNCIRSHRNGCDQTGVRHGTDI
jgi:hypothetical protein